MVANLPCLTTYEHEMFYLLRAGIVLRQKAGPGGSMDVWRFWQLGRYRAGAPINSSMVTALPSITHGLPEIYVEVCWVICDAANLIPRGAGCHHLNAWIASLSTIAWLIFGSCAA